MAKAAAAKILIVDDDPGHRKTLMTLIADWGYEVTGAEVAKAQSLWRKKRLSTLFLWMCA